MNTYVEYYFKTVWGLLSILIVLATLALTMLSFVSNELLQPVASLRVASPIAFLCTFVIAFYLFSVRDDLFRLDATRQFREKPGRPIAIWALVAFVIAVLLAFLLIFALTTHAAFIGPQGVNQADLSGKVAWGGLWHMLIKLTFTSFLALILILLSLSAGLMGIYDYGKSLRHSDQMPQFMDTGTLKQTVLGIAREELDIGARATVTDMKRTPSGGIRLTLHDRGGISTDKESNVKYREDTTWSIVADYEGKLVEVSKDPPRMIKIGS